MGISSFACLVVSYNQESTISRTLESIINSKCFDEIVISDDGSSDSTVSRAIAFLDGNRLRYKIVSGPRVGTYENFKRGLLEISSEWFTAIAADDYVESESLRKLANRVRFLEDRQIIIPQICKQHISSKGEVSLSILPPGVSGMKSLDKIAFGISGTAAGGGAIYNTNFAKSTLMKYVFINYLVEDWLIFTLLLMHGATFIPAREITYRYIKFELPQIHYSLNKDDFSHHLKITTQDIHGFVKNGQLGKIPKFALLGIDERKNNPYAYIINFIAKIFRNFYIRSYRFFIQRRIFLRIYEFRKR
jgi:glycosyltransferase involved in cell wall biosynthesis